MALDANRELRIEYIRLLKGQVLVDGTPVPVYNKYVYPNADGSFPSTYIILNESASGQVTGSQKHGKIGMIVTCYHKDQFNSGIEVESMAAQVYEIIQPNAMDVPLNPNGFQIGHTMALQDIPDTYPDVNTSAQNNGSANIVMERKIFFEHTIFYKQGA